MDFSLLVYLYLSLNMLVLLSIARNVLLMSFNIIIFLWYEICIIQMSRVIMICVLIVILAIWYPDILIQNCPLKCMPSKWPAIFCVDRLWSVFSLSVIKTAIAIIHALQQFPSSLIKYSFTNCSTSNGSFGSFCYFFCSLFYIYN